MRIVIQLTCLSLITGVLPVAWANGGGMSMPAMPSMPRELTPQQKARDAYNDGVHDVKKADKAQNAATEATDAGKKDKAAGLLVLEGIIRKGLNARLTREDVIISKTTISSLRRFKDDVNEVREGFEFGIALDGWDDIEVGDTLEDYASERV